MPERSRIAGDAMAPADRMISPSRPRLVLYARPAVDDGARAAVLEQHLVHTRLGFHVEVPPPHYRAQVGAGGAVATAEADRSLIGPGAFLPFAVHVRVEGNTDLLRRLDEHTAERMGRRHVGDFERAVGAVVLARAERVGLHALEVGQHVAVAPGAGVSDEARPVVVVLVLAAQVDHAVDGARPAEHLAARPHGVAAVERGVGLAHVHPVEAGV